MQISKSYSSNLNCLTETRHHLQTLSFPMQQNLATSQNVAVVGAGAAGLAAARELRREGHRVVVFERQSQLGGTWVYSSEVESDPIGLDPNRKIVHSSLYASLRTNLPREVMGFTDFPFVSTGAPSGDSRRYPRREEVLRYLEDFARKFELNDLVRFETELKHVGEENGKMRVRSTRQGGNGSEEDEIFDAVVICTGHYTEPRIADIPGIEEWPGRQIHSHSYRLPESYKNLDVVVIGGGASAGDISREIAAVAKELHIASMSAAKEAFGKVPGFDNMWLHPMIASANKDGTITFEDGSRVLADVVIHCTGYQYKFPFLNVQDAVTVDDNRVGPLYKHVFPPSLAPRLSFVGVPYKVIGFPLFEVQSRWIAGVLSGRISLPSAEEMMEDVEAFYSKLDNAGVPKRYTHLMLLHQLEYDGWLSKQCGCAPMEAWRKKMAIASLKLIKDRPNAYRDEWDGNEAFKEAQKRFIEHLREAALSSL